MQSGAYDVTRLHQNYPIPVVRLAVPFKDVPSFASVEWIRAKKHSYLINCLGICGFHADLQVYKTRKSCSKESSSSSWSSNFCVAISLSIRSFHLIAQALCEAQQIESAGDDLGTRRSHDSAGQEAGGAGRPPLHP